MTTCPSCGGQGNGIGRDDATPVPGTCETCGRPLAAVAGEIDIAEAVRAAAVVARREDFRRRLLSYGG